MSIALANLAIQLAGPRVRAIVPQSCVSCWNFMNR